LNICPIRKREHPTTETSTPQKLQNPTSKAKTNIKIHIRHLMYLLKCILKNWEKGCSEMEGTCASIYNDKIQKRQQNERD